MSEQKEEKLPQGWITASLDDVTIRVTDGSHFSPKSIETGLPYITVKDINDDKIDFENCNRISKEDYDTLVKSGCKPEKGDILFSKDGTVGKVSLIDFNTDFVVLSSLAIIRPHTELISPKYLYYATKTSAFLKQALSRKKGIAIRRIILRDLRNIKLNVAPFAEQQFIIEELEIQFSKLDEAVKLLKRMQVNLRKLRSSTLKWASQGKLVPTEAELARKDSSKYEAAAELFHHIIKDRRAKWESEQVAVMQEKVRLQKDDKWKEKYVEPAIARTEDLSKLPEGWVWATLEQISWDAGYGSSEKTDYELSGLPILRIPNISKGLIDTSDLKRASPSLKVKSENTLKTGDFLIIRTNGSKDLLGRGALVQTAFDEPHYFASYLIRFRLLGEQSLHKWIALIWNSDVVRYWIESKTATTAGQYNINLQILNSLRIPLPPVNEYKRITIEVEHRFSVIDGLEKVVETNLKRSEKLRQKILQDAFQGKLVKQNPKDEPAEKLLERIKSQREANRSVRKTVLQRNKTDPKSNKPKVSNQGLLFSESNSTQTMDEQDTKPPRNIKLLRLVIEGEYKSLLNFQQKFRAEDEFHNDISPICLVGLNGSGKSNLIEALSEIFCYLELINLPFKGKGSFQQNKQRDLQFEIEYELTEKGAKNKRVIKITKEKSRPPIFFEIVNERELQLEHPNTQLAALPKWVIGYSSGLNETISIPYSQIQYYYSQDVGVRAFQEDTGAYTDIRTLFMDYDSNAAILISNYLLGSRSNLNLFREKLRIGDVTSFDVVFQLDRGSRRKIELTNELKKYKESLSNCAYEIKTDKKGKYLSEIYKFRIDEKTRKSFLVHFKTAKTLFIALYKFSMLNSLALTGEERRFYLRDDVREGSLEKPPTVTKDDKVFNIDSLRLKITDPEKDIDYAGISDGEHQLIQVFGSIQLFDEPGTLFLLDEPESHFNPRWRREFIEFLDEIKSTKQQEFVISTHSPFVVSGCRRENVFHFERENDRVYCRPVDFETYGSSFEYLLTKLFKMESLISKQAFEEMREVIKSKDLDKLQEAVTIFGESFEKRFLYEEIARLKNQK